MSKAEQTRGRIIEQAAGLFNQRGYAGTSMSDLMAATGLKKGGIYNHFATKDELAIAAFDFAVQQARRIHIKALKGKRSGREKLQAMVYAFVDSFDDISAWGGCPLMNTAIASDDTHSLLRAKTQQAMNHWQSLIQHITQNAINVGEFAADLDPDTVATIMIAVLEGALMLSQLYGDRSYLDRARTHLDHYIVNLKAVDNRP